MATAVLVGQTTAATQKKRPRLNPARRNSAKAKEQSQIAPAASVAKTGDSVEVQAKKPDTISITKPRLPGTPVTKQSTRPKAPLSKTTSAALPVAVTRSSSHNPQKSAKQDESPSLNTAGGSQGGSLALAAPSFVTGGLLGCAAGAAVLLGSGLLKNAVGVDSALLAARSAKAVLNNLIDDSIASMKAGTYSSVDALDMLRRITLAYAALVPGGVAFVEKLFREVEMVRKQRGHEIDQVVAEGSAELSAAKKRGAGAAELQNITLSNLVKLSDFTSAATQDIVARNPRLSPYRDGAAKALQSPRQPQTPTVKLNMTIKQKHAAAA